MATMIQVSCHAVGHPRAANTAAAQADAAYLVEAKPPSWMYYSGMYFTHNYQFLAYSESMRGRSAGALQACREMKAHLTEDVLHMGTGLDWYAAEPWFVLERFGGLVVCSACSGHGFKFVPAIGEAVAALAAG